MKFFIVKNLRSLFENAVYISRFPFVRGMAALLLVGLLARPVISAVVPGFYYNKTLNAVVNVAAMKVLPVALLQQGTGITVLGYYTSGDMPASTWNYSTSACTLNSGAGDGGSQIPNTAGGCWLIGQESEYDVRWWGAVAGGTDPYWTSGNTGNSLAFTNFFAYLQSLGGASPFINGTFATGGGQLYGVNYPLIDNAKYSKFEDTSLVALSSTNFPCGSSAVLESVNATNRDIDYINIDSGMLPVNGFAVMSNGTQQFDNIRTSHWLGACSTVTATSAGTATTGSNYVTLAASPASYGLKTGMVIRGTSTLAAGIMDRTVIMDTQTSPANAIILSKPVQAAQASFTLTQTGTVATVTATNYGQILVGSTLVIPGFTTETVSSYGTASSTQGGTGTYNVSVNQTIGTATAGTIALGSQTGFTIAANVEPCGIVWGLGGANTGGTYTNLTSFEYNSSDTNANVNAAKWGFAACAVGGATNLNFDHWQFNQAVAGLYIDKGVGGITGDNGSVFNANWNYTELQAHGILQGPDGGQLALPNYSTNVPIETFNTDANGAPLVQLAGSSRLQNTSAITETPQAFVQVYNNQTAANFQNVNVDFATMQMPNSYVMASVFGPGTVSVQPNDYFNTTWSAANLFSDGQVNAGTNVLAGNNITAGQFVKTPGFLSNGTRYTTTGGCPNVKVGGATAGSFTTTSTTCAGTITLNGATGLAATTGWACDFEDLTTAADKNNVYETAYTTTTVTFASGAVVAGDLIVFKCTGF